MNASELILTKKNIFRSDDNKFIKINCFDVIYITLSTNIHFICLFDKIGSYYIFNHCELESKEYEFYLDDSPLCEVKNITRIRLATEHECLLLLDYCANDFCKDKIQTFINKTYGKSVE